jgi:hypothetical protein
MNTAEYVTNLIAEQRTQGISNQLIAWNAAKACVGWPYVFGARWQYCTPANRRRFYRDDHPTIKTACKNFDGSTSGKCAGCKWYPDNKYTRINDCRGFTYGVLYAVYAWELMGSGCTQQWQKDSNWKAKGTVAEGIPKDTLVCLFVNKGSKMEHTGFGYNGETVECSSGVQYFKTMKSKWTHWGVAACIEGDVPVPTPTPVSYPTLRKGSSGQYVIICQNKLIEKGYSCGPKGADGKYGDNTVRAVKEFQANMGLKSDGICGPMTWAKLLEDAPAVETKYKVTITGLDRTQAQALVNNYPGSTMEEE